MAEHSSKRRRSPSKYSSSSESSLDSMKFRNTRFGEETKKQRRLTFKSGIQLSDEYDFTRERTAARRLELKAGIMTVVKSCLGGGIFCIHRAYNECGLWLALITNILLGAMMAYCMYTLAAAAQTCYTRMKMPPMTYPELIEVAFENAHWRDLRSYSKNMKYWTEVFMVINCLGSCAIMHLMVAKQVKQLVDGSEHINLSIWPSVSVYVRFFILPCIMISMITRWKHLAPFSMVLNIFIVVLSVVIIFYSAFSNTKKNVFKTPMFNSWDGLFRFVGNVQCAMDGILYTLAVENNIKDPKTYPKALGFGMAIIVTLTATLGSFGCWGFGDRSTAPVTVNFPWGEFSVQMKMFLSIMMFIQYPMSLWAPANIVWNYAACYHEEEHYWIWERVYRIVLIVATSTVAFLLPNPTKVAGMIGACCVPVLTYIFPTIISLLVHWENPGPGRYYWRGMIWAAMLLFGLTNWVMGTYYNGKALVEYINFLLGYTLSYAH